MSEFQNSLRRLREKLVEESLKYLGYSAIHYKGRNYGQDENGFDCSGFITFLLKKINFPLTEGIRYCNEYFDNFGVFIHEEFREPGDLIFFSRRGQAPKHMGIVKDFDSYIHSPGRDGEVVCIEQIKKVKIKPSIRQIYGTNPIGYKRLAALNGRYQVI